MPSEITEFVNDNIYPSLNAVEEGFLDDLNPRKSGDAYVCDCPVCGRHKKAYYYPNTGYVVCNRKNNCGQSTSVWDCLIERGFSKFDALKTMADAVGVDLPSDDNKSTRKTAEIVKDVLKYGLSKSKRGMEYMTQTRGWSEQEIADAPIGYIHKMEYFLNSLRKQGVTEEELNDWGYIYAEQKGEEFGFEYSMEARIVGWWETPDGKLKLWGRDVSNSRKEKYRYQDDLIKDMPCYWNERLNKDNRSNLIFVEGPMDSARMIANNVPSCAIGGSSISSGMSIFLAERISYYLHWIDNDNAGHVGAGTSISKTNPFGIYSTIFYAPDERFKDADEALNQLDVDQLIALIEEHAMGCGTFLAQGFIAALNAPDADANSLYSRARIYNAKLQGIAKTEYFNCMNEAGILVDNPTSSALRAMADLIDNGVSEAQAKRIIRSRFELSISTGSTH